MGMRLTENGFRLEPDPEVWELSERECHDLAMWLADSTAAHVMIDSEGIKFKLNNHELAIWSRGLGKRVE